MLASVYVLLVGLAYRWWICQLCGGKEGVASLFVFATNPFVGLVLAILATALVQSSSTVTSIIVGLVAAGLPINVAIPMIMGANVGTTVTNTLVSIGHVRRPDEFKNAFAAATIHDFFNLLSILVFLPLELVFGVLEKLSGTVTHFVENIETIDASGNGLIKVVVGSGTRLLESLTSFLPERWAGSVQIVLGIALILLSIMFLGKALKSVFVGKAQSSEAAIAKAVGIVRLLYGLVQSSSTTLAYRTLEEWSDNLRQVYPLHSVQISVT